jgi:hypothetical protein
MPTKKELMSIIDSQQKGLYTKGEVKTFINTIVTADSKPPLKYKKGDVIANGIGVKKRPIVVIRIIGELLFCIPLSTTKDEFNLCESDSRFMGSGWFSKGLSVVSKEYANDNFIGVYDNPKLLNKAIHQLKLLLLKL